MNRKRLFTAAVLLCLSLLCGCSRIRERLEKELWERSGVPEDASYLQYRTLEETDHLDEEGRYWSEELEQQRQAALEVPSGTVHVSFARNDYLKVSYFADAGLTEALPGENCWLDPGDAIYVSEPVLMNPHSTLYQFSEFQIREYDAAGNMKALLAESRNSTGEIYRIPEDFRGTEIAVIPLGSYRSRTVTLNAVYVQSGGAEKVLENGIWEINGKRYGNGTVSLNPMESYRVVYDYSAYKDDWYFAGSVPDSYWDADGTITFLAVPFGEEHVDYKVVLHPYGSMTVENGVSYLNAVDSFLDSASAIFGNKSVIGTQDIIDLIQVNGITAINNFSDTEVSLSELKAGDQVLIRVPGELKVIADGMSLPAPEEKDGFLEYRFPVPDREEMQFRLSVSRRNSTQEGVYHVPAVPRGKLNLYDSVGIRYTAGSELPAENERVTVEIIPDEKWCIYGKNVKNNVYREEMSYAAFTADLDGIIAAHHIKPGITVILDTADENGECVFWTGNDLISGEVVLREGQDLQFDYALRQDAGLEIIMAPEDRGEPLNIWSPLAANRQLEVTAEMNGTTLRCRDFLTFKEGVTTDVFENSF